MAKNWIDAKIWMNYSNIRDKTKHLLPEIVRSMIKELFLLWVHKSEDLFFLEKSGRCFSLYPWHFSMAIVFTLHFRPLYYFDIDHLDIPATSGYSEEVIRRNYDELIDYNSISGPSRLTFSDFMMSEKGEIHFEEVKRIFLNIEYASFVLVRLRFCWPHGRSKEKCSLLCRFIRISDVPCGDRRFACRFELILFCTVP